MKLTNKKTQIALYSAGAFIIAAIGVFFAFTNSNTSLENTTLVRIQNFIPGHALEYEMVFDDNEVIKNKKIANRDGSLNIDLPPLEQNVTKAIKSLRVKLDDGQKSIGLEYPQTTGEIKMSASGLPIFSEINNIYGQERETLKTDWTGEFEYVLPEIKEGSTKLAFNGLNIMGDAEENNPLTIEIMTTSGGGGPTSSGVNQYSNEGCGQPKLSTCEGSIKNHTKSVTARYPKALQDMSNQFVAVMMQYVLSIGQILDAKMVLQTQTLFQKLSAQAHKDFAPSGYEPDPANPSSAPKNYLDTGQMCVFGSFTKTMANAEETSRFNTLAINKSLMDQYGGTNKLGNPMLNQTASDMQSRIKAFREIYCDPQDFNNGLEYMCQHDPVINTIMSNEKIGGQDGNRLNNDIDYVRVIDTPMTLKVNFTDGELTQTGSNPSDEIYSYEADIIAMAKNLYWPSSFIGVPSVQLKKEFSDYLNARHIITIQNIAHNSFAHIVGMKSESVSPIPESGPSFMKSFMRDFGLTDTEIEDIMGTHPSYWAQMDMLTKKLYQNPNFYVNLYDKPANVKRISASMEAIKLMQMRDWFESNLRREMMMSALLEKNIHPRIEAVSQRLGVLEAGR